MDHNFEVSSTSEAPGPIVSAVYNESIGEIVTVGPGYITVSLRGKKALPFDT